MADAATFVPVVPQLTLSHDTSLFEMSFLALGFVSFELQETLFFLNGRSRGAALLRRAGKTQRWQNERRCEQRHDCCLSTAFCHYSVLLFVH